MSGSLNFIDNLLDKVNKIDLLTCCSIAKKYVGDEKFFETHCVATAIKVALAVNRKYGLQFGEDWVKFKKANDIYKFTDHVINSKNTLFTIYSFSDGQIRLVEDKDDGHATSIIALDREYYIIESAYCEHSPEYTKVTADIIEEMLFDLYIQYNVKWLSHDI